ncbi:DUF961 family protein [Carnobacterium maltaromaticum]|uniref:DUF961 family protein n=1 Tax=Carnobacterium maltaromaticum TaxID=2751 RepID=UPI00295E4268|nr:DUF961 family protein [Carnobacterium maltaromaticum]
MALEFVVPQKETFGKMEFVDFGKNIEETVNGKMKVTGHQYSLISVEQKEEILVIIPPSIAKKTFEEDTLVEILNPVLKVKGNRIGTNNAYAEWICYADDIISVGVNKSE